MTMRSGESEQAGGSGPPALHLTADEGVQAYKEAYPRLEKDGSHRTAFIPGRSIVHVAATQGTWAQVIVEGQVVGWVEGSYLVPPIGTRIAAPAPNQPPPPVARNGTTINVGTLVAVLAGIGIIMGAVLDWTQGVGANSFKIPAAFLVDRNTRTLNPRLGYLVVALGIVGLLLAFVRNGRGWRALVGLAAVGVAVLYCGQIAIGLSDIHSSASFTDFVGAGPWLTGIAGVALVASAFVDPEF
jgi:hypothetical protein